MSVAVVGTTFCWVNCLCVQVRLIREKGPSGLVRTSVLSRMTACPRWWHWPGIDGSFPSAPKSRGCHLQDSWYQHPSLPLPLSRRTIGIRCRFGNVTQERLTFFRTVKLQCKDQTWEPPNTCQLPSPALSPELFQSGPRGLVQASNSKSKEPHRYLIMWNNQPINSPQQFSSEVVKFDQKNIAPCFDS